MKMNQKRFTNIILIIVVAMLAGAVGYFVFVKKSTPIAQQTPTPSQTNNTTSPTQTQKDETADWKTYSNNKYDFSLKYPKEWILKEFSKSETDLTGAIFSLKSSESNQLLNGGTYPGYEIYEYNLMVSFWPTINNAYARGGSWRNQKNYTNLADFFDDKNAPKQKIGETTIDGENAYEVVIGGFMSNYGIMIEHDNGIYELSFQTASDKSKLSPTEKQILSTFGFTKFQYYTYLFSESEILPNITFKYSSLFGGSPTYISSRNTNRPDNISDDWGGFVQFNPTGAFRNRGLRMEFFRRINTEANFESYITKLATDGDWASPKYFQTKNYRVARLRHALPSHYDGDVGWYFVEFRNKEVVLAISTSGDKKYLYNDDIDGNSTRDKIISTLTLNAKDFGDAGIIVVSPENNQIIFSPLKITGYINDFGDGWEADFGSVELVDGNGKRMAISELAIDLTNDRGEYNKIEPYDFESILIFELPQTKTGTLIFRESDARGAYGDKEFKLPVRFDKK